MVKLLALIMLAAASIGACTLFDEDPPTDSCTTDTDCFRAQGEFCEPRSKTCELRGDAGVDSL